MPLSDCALCIVFSSLQVLFWDQLEAALEARKKPLLRNFTTRRISWLQISYVVKNRVSFKETSNSYYLSGHPPKRNWALQFISEHSIHDIISVQIAESQERVLNNKQKILYTDQALPTEILAHSHCHGTDMENRGLLHSYFNIFKGILI